MKKVFILLCVSALFFSGCLTYYTGKYDVELESVERPANAQERYGESEILSLETEGVSQYVYTDDLVKVILIPLSDQIKLFVQNNTDHSIKIVWDDAAFVGVSGKSSRVMHSGVRYIDKNNPQPPSVIPKGSTLDDIIVPVDNIYFSGSNWITLSILLDKTMDKKLLSDFSKEAVGKSLVLVLPIKIEDVVNEYVFTLKVKNFTETGTIVE